MNVRELANDKSNFRGGRSLLILDFVVKKRARASCVLLSLFYEELSTWNDGVFAWYDILETPIHRVILWILDQRHPEKLGLISIRSVEIRTNWVLRIKSSQIVKLLVVDTMDPKIIDSVDIELNDNANFFLQLLVKIFLFEVYRLNTVN